MNNNIDQTYCILKYGEIEFSHEFVMKLPLELCLEIVLKAFPEYNFHPSSHQYPRSMLFGVFNKDAFLGRNNNEYKEEKTNRILEVIINYEQARV